MRHFLILVTLITCLPGADVVLSDEEMVAMATRRVRNNDLGFTGEHWAELRRHTERDTKDWVVRIHTRGKVADQRTPIRFKVLAGNSPSLSDQYLPSLIIDAWFSRDDFGTWKMEWKYNIDQTLAEREKNNAVLDKAGKQVPDIQFVSTLPALLKSKIFPAQVQFQGGAYRDDDQNRIGEYADDLEVLSGDRKTKDGTALNFLPRNLSADLTKNTIFHQMLTDGYMGFWFFAYSPINAKTLIITHEGSLLEADGTVLPKTVAEAKSAVGKARKYDSTK